MPYSVLHRTSTLCKTARRISVCAFDFELREDQVTALGSYSTGLSHQERIRLYTPTNQALHLDSYGDSGRPKIAAADQISA